MSDETVRVTRKGQVTIPASKRKKYAIREERANARQGKWRRHFHETDHTDRCLAGVDAGKVHLTEMRRKLDAMRQQDGY